MKVGIGCYNGKDAKLSGRKVAEYAIENGSIDKPDLVCAFCSGTLDHGDFFEGLQSVIGNDVPIIGGSAVGIITNDYLSYEDYPAGAAVVQSDTLQHRVAAADDLDKDERLAGKRLAAQLSSKRDDKLLFILYDSIKLPATHNSPPVLNASSPLIEGIEQALQSNMPVVGAGVVGDYGLGPTRQFCGSFVGSQNAVGCMLSGSFTPYVRIMHGCTPLDGVYHRITRIEGSVVYELDGKPIVALIDELYGNQDWQNQNPVSLLTIGKNCGAKFEEPKESDYVNRLITGVLPNREGIVVFEPDFEEGTEVQFMLRDTARMIESAKRNSAGLMEQIKADQRRALFGIYIDCAGRTASYSNTLTEEASEVQKVFNQHKTPLFGFYSGVEVAPLLGKSRGLDWTGVLLVFAEE